MSHANSTINASELAELWFDNVNVTIKNELSANLRKIVFTYLKFKKAKSDIRSFKDEGDVLTQDSGKMVEIMNNTYAPVFVVVNTYTKVLPTTKSRLLKELKHQIFKPFSAIYDLTLHNKVP